jgi:hypothetical protein
MSRSIILNIQKAKLTPLKWWQPMQIEEKLRSSLPIIDKVASWQIFGWFVAHSQS